VAAEIVTDPSDNGEKYPEKVMFSLPGLPGNALSDRLCHFLPVTRLNRSSAAVSARSQAGPRNDNKNHL
jgi:hypothetical protein